MGTPSHKKQSHMNYYHSTPATHPQLRVEDHSE